VISNAPFQFSRDENEAVGPLRHGHPLGNAKFRLSFPFSGFISLCVNSKASPRRSFATLFGLPGDVLQKILTKLSLQHQQDEVQTEVDVEILANKLSIDFSFSD